MLSNSSRDAYYAPLITGSIPTKTRPCRSPFDPPVFFVYPARKKSDSSPALSHLAFTSMPNGNRADSDDDDVDDSMIYTARRPPRSASSPSLRTRIFGLGARAKVQTISTAPGYRGAGETETELDEPPRHLPTSRIISPSGPLVPPSTLQQRFTPLLFEFSRLLSIVPAIFGTLYNIYFILNPPDGRRAPQRIDFFVSALWAVLTGYQCLSLTTGLLTRWRVYYPPLPTLIRLLALQAICWPATHLSLTLLDHTKRPAAVWAAIGTTTCMSRSVQIWVTSNLWWEPREAASSNSNTNTNTNSSTNNNNNNNSGGGGGSATSAGGWRRFGGRWSGRRWDWREVSMKCMLPAGVLYFVMAWAEQLRREWDNDC